MTGYDVIIYIYVVFLLLYNIAFGNDIKVALNDGIYYSVSIIQLNWLRKNDNIISLSSAFKRHYILLGFVCVASTAFVGVGMLFPGMYDMQWGYDFYYIGFAKTGHTLASSCCLVMCLCLYLVYTTAHHIMFEICMCIIFLAIFMSGARVFIVSVVILMYCMMRRQLPDLKKRFLAYVPGVTLVVVALKKTAMFNKFTYLLDNIGSSDKYGMINVLTNNRIRLWELDLRDWSKSNIFIKIFGRGFDYIYTLNLKELYKNIWAHNDFINILVCCGILGLIIYIVTIKRYFDSINIQDNFIKLAFLTYFLFPAMLNGFYMYYHYVISFMIFTMALQTQNRDI